MVFCSRWVYLLEKEILYCTGRYKRWKEEDYCGGVSDDKIIYTKGILRYVDADGNTKISGCR